MTGGRAVVRRSKVSLRGGLHPRVYTLGRPRNAAYGGGGHLPELLLQRLLVLGVDLLAEPLIDGFIYLPRHLAGRHLTKARR